MKILVCVVPDGENPRLDSRIDPVNISLASVVGVCRNILASAFFALGTTSGTSCVVWFLLFFS